MKKVVVLLLTLALVFGMFFAVSTSVSAASTETLDGLEVTITTDKGSYEFLENVQALVSIKNNNSYAVEDVSIEVLLPSGLKLKEGSTEFEDISIPAGETYETGVIVLKQSYTSYNSGYVPSIDTTSSSTESSEPAESSKPVESSKPEETSSEEATSSEDVTSSEDSSEPEDTTSSEDTSVPNDSSMSDSSEQQTNAPTSNNTLAIVLGTVLVVAAAAVSVIIAVKHKKTIKMLSLLLCITMVATAIPMGVFAAGNDSNTIVVDTTIFVDGNNYTIKAEVERGKTSTPTTEEEVSEEVAELFGIDPDEYDTDNDGLSNYVEIYKSGTDPKMADTDENGISDADEDLDEDGLTNIQECSYGTDLSLADTDYDGISDYKEINEINTNPLKADTDEDGLSDGDELVLGLDPLVQKTDGVTLDSERTFTQELDEDNISEQLTSEDNDAVPSLTLTASGNVNSRVTITTNSSSDFSDSRAIVGEPIDVSGNDLGEGTISFTLKNAVSTFAVRDVATTFNTNLICKYNEDGTTEYLDTSFDADKNTISAELNGEGTYFVMDVKNLFDELGLSLPTVSDIETLTDPEPITTYSVGREFPNNNSNENGMEPPVTYSLPSEVSVTESASEDTVKITTRASSGVMAQADIVFLIDTTGSMGDEIYNVKENVQYFVDALKEKGVSAGLALIDYQDITVDGYDSTRVHKNGTSNWFYDVDAYKSAISALELGYGGDAPECAVDALETARLLDMRASAGKIFILVTDADYKTDNRYGIPSMAAEIELLKNAEVTCAVVSPSWEKNTYDNLFTETDGLWADIYGDFYTELMTLADKIGSDIVGDGYWIYLNGPIPVPVRLDEEPREGSTVDTDKDGIYDIDELEGATPTKYIDLDALVTKISDGIITGTDYGMVMMYEYESDPTLEDTDFDGIEDKEDKDPRNNTFYGELLGHRNINCATYKIDYRDFFESSENYNRDIASASLIFANTIYSGSSFKYNDTGMLVSDIEGLLDFHGFNETSTFELKPMFYLDDELSEIGFGYHDVEYNGKILRIVAVVVRGTNGTTAEWSSNFNLGNPSDWKSEYHKGFYVTEERIREYLESYVSNLNSNDVDDTVFWVTGHSRGAAIANILSAKLIDDGNKVFAYTFATPSTTVSANWNDSKYNSIFNFANASDVVTYVPLQQWNFNRFGITWSVSIEESLLEDFWRKQTGRDKYNALDESLIKSALNRIYKSCGKTWAEVYEYSGKQKIDDKQYSYISARARNYCRITEEQTIFGGWNRYLYPSTAFVLQLAAEFIADETPELQKSNNRELLIELWNTKYGAMLLLLFGDVVMNLDKLPDEVTADLLFDTHAPATYYVLIP